MFVTIRWWRWAFDIVSDRVRKTKNFCLSFTTTRIGCSMIFSIVTTRPFPPVFGVFRRNHQLEGFPSVIYSVLLLLSLPLTNAQDDVVNNTFGYPRCQGMSYDFDGYTFIQIPYTDTKLWSHCAFPNPLYDHKRCGRPEIKGRHYLCDPDKLVDSEKTGE